MNFTKLYEEIDRRLVSGRVILAIEGGSASGKSTLSWLLANKYDCTTIHMDDFFLQKEQRNNNRLNEVGGNIDKERFIDEVLPCLNNDLLIYRKFDCKTMSFGETIKEPLKKLIVIEGVYSMHPEFKKYYDLSVFLDISKELQKERILKRNSSNFVKRFFEEWIPMEEKYFDKTNIKDKCDLIICVK